MVLSMTVVPTCFSLPPVHSSAWGLPGICLPTVAFLRWLPRGLGEGNVQRLRWLEPDQEDGNKVGFWNLVACVGGGGIETKTSQK